MSYHDEWENDDEWNPNLDDTSSLVEIDFEKIIKETKKAYLVRIKNTDEESVDVWLPKSQCEFVDEEAKTMEIPEWLANDKEL